MNGKALFALSFLTLVPTRVLAQTEDPPAVAAAPVEHVMVAGLDLAAVMPVGDLADAAGLGFGGLARFELGLTSKVRVTGRAGYIYHLEKNSGNFSQIPVLGGAKLDFTPNFYGAAELGLFAVRFSGGTRAGSTNSLGMTLGVGYRIADFDLRLGIQAYDVADVPATLQGTLNIGYNFWTGS